MTTTVQAIRPTSPAEATTVDRAGQPRWALPALVLLLAGTAVLYLWNLGASSDANSFYAAAVQAGTQSWKALFFGSLDPSNFITVDKPPAALWVMALSGRLFGFSSWSMLVPQALEGIASVWLLFATVRRWSGPAAGLVAGAVLALTPVAALMFRFNNPDALLVLLLVLGAYGTVRAIEKASVGWLMLAGTAIGFGFITKMLQAFLVLPAFALVYLLAAPTPLRRRIGHLLAAGLALVVSAGWYVAVVELTPASNRPYIGGSTTNSLLELALGYNGLGRVFGGQGNGGGGGPGGGGGGNVMFGGSTGITRLFGESMGTEISWLLPAALIALFGGLWFTRHAPRTDRTRAALLLWGGWLLVTGLVFSYMQGTIHPYYTVALAPAIAALVAVAGRELWRGRAHWPARIVLALLVAVTAVWDFVLLDRTADWLPALRVLLLVAGGVVVLALLFAGQRRRLASVLLTVTLLTGFGATAAYAVDTAATPHTGSIPTSGPAPASFGGGGGPGGFGGGPDTGNNDSALVTALESTSTRWAAATSGAQQAAGLELAGGKAVMAIGGFTGSDPTPTLAQFERYVENGQIHYFIAGGRGFGGGAPGGQGAGNTIEEWVADHYTAVTIGGETVYDLTRPIG